jgi:hypothetical protein
MDKKTFRRAANATKHPMQLTPFPFGQQGKLIRPLAK